MPAPLRDGLEERPWDFEFFQAVRLLLRYAGGRGIGGAAQPGTEPVRFGVHPSLSFPPSELRSLDSEDMDAPPALTVQFFGLTGPTGVMPVNYTAYMIERLQARDATFRDFCDLFHHRLLSLFYKAWEKHRHAVPYERGEDDRFSHYLMDLIGLGTPGLAGRQAVPDQALLYYTGLLGQQPRSAVAFRQLLSDYFGVPVEVEPFTGAWRPIDPGSQSVLMETRTRAEQLGFGVILGDEVWDQQSVVRVRLGPLTLRQYRDYLPDGPAYQPLKALARFFCGEDVDVEVQLVLKREEAPRFSLDVEGEPAPQLGWISWMFSRELDRDPDDTVLRLWEG